MARLGIDYGTTNTVVACSDRGRYPLVPHVTETSIGRVVRESFPSLMVCEVETGRLRFGADAERALTEPGADLRFVPIRSLKRLLRDYVDGARFAGNIVPGGLDVRDTFRQFTCALLTSVRNSGMIPADEPLEAVLTWPAHANGAQRHVTRASFSDAGFRILQTVNEPSAAAIELADRLVHGNRAKAHQLKTSVAVFDLGGGTFDASVVKVDGSDYTVLGSAGIEDLGGDDFDDVLARLFAGALKLDFEALSHFQRTLLLMHACREKERISSGNLRNLTLDPEEIGLSGPACKVTVAAFEKRLTGLIEPSVAKLAEVIDKVGAHYPDVTADSLEAIYLVGGSSRLPLVGKLIAKRFPKARLFTTDKPFSATAMGAAILSAETVRVHDVFARHFGVIRLAEHGTREVFDPVFKSGLPLPAPGAPPLSAEVRYVPRHNIGHLRYLECATVDAQGNPAAGIRPWSEILFPYDPALALAQALQRTDIESRYDITTETSETYCCDSDGIITVRLTRGGDNQSRTFEVSKI
jgi:molecular chaperone DnaK (HSP70)